MQTDETQPGRSADEAEWYISERFAMRCIAGSIDCPRSLYAKWLISTSEKTVDYKIAVKVRDDSELRIRTHETDVDDRVRNDII